MIVEAVTRLLPGAVGNEASTRQESFTVEDAGAMKQRRRGFDLRVEWIAGLSALHASGGVSRDGSAGGVDVRQP